MTETFRIRDWVIIAEPSALTEEQARRAGEYLSRLIDEEISWVLYGGPAGGSMEAATIQPCDCRGVHRAGCRYLSS